MRRDRPLLFIPTYNERENVGEIHARIRSLGIDLDLLFIDDDSPDGTGLMLDDLQRRDDRVSVVHRQGKMGIGSAHRSGIEYAYENGYAVLLTMDCDLTHSASDIPRLLAAGRRADVVLASRFLHPKGLSDWNPVRKALTWIGHLLTTWVLRVPHDATGGFRLYRLDRIPRGIFRLATSNSYSFLFESLYYLCRCGAVVDEVPIVLTKRAYGHSKMTARDVYRSVKKLIDLYVGAFHTRTAVRDLRAARELLAVAETIEPRELYVASDRGGG